VLTSAIAFMADPALAECVLPGEGGGFDIEQFLRQQGTLYLIGESRGQSTPIAPLFAGLVSEIHWTATQLGSAMRGARLDPPLALVLDEVTQIVPIPLPSILVAVAL
jgi:type IV secretion system protein VirD4